MSILKVDPLVRIAAEEQSGRAYSETSELPAQMGRHEAWYLLSTIPLKWGASKLAAVSRGL
jgi:hypothetical protein